MDTSLRQTLSPGSSGVFFKERERTVIKLFKYLNFICWYVLLIERPSLESLKKAGLSGISVTFDDNFHYKRFKKNKTVKNLPQRWGIHPMKTKLAKLPNTRPTKYLTQKTTLAVWQLSDLHNNFRYQLPECGTAPLSISTLHTVTWHWLWEC